MGFFGAVLSGPFPVLSFLKVCHLGAWWFRGIPVGFLSCPLPLGHILIVSCRIPFSCFWGGGERERIYYYQYLLCTAVTLTIDLIYEFPVTVGRIFTCVLDGFSDLIMLAWAFRAVLIILLGLRV